MKNWIRGGIVATGIVGLSFFMANTEANEELFQQLKLEGLGVNVNLLKADTQGLLYERNGGLYRFTLEEGLPHKVNLLENSTMYTYYLVEGGLIYTDVEGNYKSYNFESGTNKDYLNSGNLSVINEGSVNPLVDSDNDSIPDTEDNCPNKPNKGQWDKDKDGIGNPCDDDIDGDGVLNVDDNCPRVSNHLQWDNNENGIGNICDPDIDGDGYSNTTEVEAGSSPWESDSTPEDTNGYVPPKDCNV